MTLDTKALREAAESVLCSTPKLCGVALEFGDTTHGRHFTSNACQAMNAALKSQVMQALADARRSALLEAAELCVEELRQAKATSKRTTDHIEACRAAERMATAFVLESTFRSLADKVKP